MNEFRADLHCHSFFSDGSDSPEALLKMANEKGLSGLSITDHDTIEAYSEQLFELAERMDLALMTGVELSSEWEGTAIHVLGYHFDLKAPSLIHCLEEVQKRREVRNREMLKKLAAHRLVIDEERWKGKRIIGRPHIAQAMVEKGYVKDIQEAFNRYLKEGALCYVSGFKLTPSDAIRAIHGAGGKAILAHPHFMKKRSLLRYLFSLPFDGLECYYGHLPKSFEAPFLKKVLEKKWIATGGSDYHGLYKPHIELGSSWVDRITFDALGTIC